MEQLLVRTQFLQFCLLLIFGNKFFHIIKIYGLVSDSVMFDNAQDNNKWKVGLGVNTRLAVWF